MRFRFDRGRSGDLTATSGLGRTSQSGQRTALHSARSAQAESLTDPQPRHVSTARALSVGPKIIVRRPQILPGEVPTIETQSPTDLDVIFEARSAPVRMDSLNVEMQLL